MSVYEKFIPNLPKARKGDKERGLFHERSLRKQAKELNSKVGEVYNPDQLEQLAGNNQMQGTKIHKPTTQQEYIETVKKLIESNHSALVFYDISIQGNDIGKPIKKKGQYEHAAAVLGYCNYDNELYFIVCQWGKFYLHKAVDIADSALQIQARDPETFYKLKQLPFMKPIWVEEMALRETLASHWLYKYAVDQTMLSIGMSALDMRCALEPNREQGLLGRCIFDIHPDPEKLTKRLICDFTTSLNEFETYIESNKKNSKTYSSLINLLKTFKEESINFNDIKKREQSILNCLTAIDLAEKNHAFEHESKPVFRVLRKIGLAFTILLTLGLAAYLKSEYSYKTTGAHTVFADITKTHGKVNLIKEVLQEHKAYGFSNPDLLETSPKIRVK
ncbi:MULTISPECIES: hypothetical protein [unclassified Legionella]|uniref:hypothetical protein n=1 Tax=unclassified Legionella TaxID=2622702 RepID=UPI001054B442|nr:MULTISPECIES: hypothetical protein [unclassified Legionella]MDI9818865.1 hypothetical protein [Legionella sp. PL877]